MKKILSVVLALGMLAAIAVTASAANTEENPMTDITNYSTKAVTVTLDDSDADTVYRVDVTWADTDFTYELAGGATWDPATHTYSTVTGAWETTTSDIKVTNHSNADVNVGFAYQQTDTGITGSFSKTSAALDTGVGLTFAGADNDTSTFTIGGTPTNGTGGQTTWTAGTIKVTLVS